MIYVELYFDSRDNPPYFALIVVFNQTLTPSFEPTCSNVFGNQFREEKTSVRMCWTHSAVFYIEQFIKREFPSLHWSWSSSPGRFSTSRLGSVKSLRVFSELRSLPISENLLRSCTISRKTSSQKNILLASRYTQHCVCTANQMYSDDYSQGIRTSNIHPPKTIQTAYIAPSWLFMASM